MTIRQGSVARVNGELMLTIDQTLWRHGLRFLDGSKQMEPLLFREKCSSYR
jgi:hypothetical protein